MVFLLMVSCVSCYVSGREGICIYIEQLSIFTVLFSSSLWFGSVVWWWEEFPLTLSRRTGGAKPNQSQTTTQALPDLAGGVTTSAILFAKQRNQIRRQRWSGLGRSTNPPHEDIHENLRPPDVSPHVPHFSLAVSPSVSPRLVGNR